MSNTDQPKEDAIIDRHLFDDAFGAWLDAHGVTLGELIDGRFVAIIDLNRLKIAILTLNQSTDLPEATETKKMAEKYYVVTEEGVEGSGQESPLLALVEYIEFSDVDEDRINEILEGKSEIEHVASYTDEEIAAMPEV